jgi:hypothetical protein
MLKNLLYFILFFIALWSLILPKDYELENNKKANLFEKFENHSNFNEIKNNNAVSDSLLKKASHKMQTKEFDSAKIYYKIILDKYFLSSSTKSAFQGLNDVNKKIERRDFFVAKKSRNSKELINYLHNYPSGNYTLKVKKLLEQYEWHKLKKSISKSDFESYIAKYPLSIYSNLAKKKIASIEKQFQKKTETKIIQFEAKENNVNHKWESNHRIYESAKDHKIPKVRVGAICCDGKRSFATGRGACSHHNGVCEWLYE